MTAISLNERRKQRTRGKLKKYNKSSRPFLTVSRSNKHIKAQVVDSNGVVIVVASSLEKDVRESVGSTSNKKAAEVVGQLLAKRSVEKKLKEVVFDRGSYLYHGRVAALADAARSGGLKF